MRKLILSLLLISALGCDDSNNVKRQRAVIKIEGMDLQILKIDSCEYLYGPWGNATVLTHKGDCSNPIHKEANR
jgi:hypothetical protein